ncbi:hypothetical protein BH23ACT2_BH23ACT2_28360 [soil metagenome]
MPEIPNFEPAPEFVPDWMFEEEAVSEPNAEWFDTEPGPDDDDEDQVDDSSFATMTTEQIKNMIPPPALIDGFLNLNSTTVTYGAPGSYKTFLALDMAFHVATGSWWWGQEVHAGPVVFVVAEGASRIGTRIDAWERHHVRLQPHHPVHWITEPVNLSEVGTVGAFIDHVVPLGPSLIVVDTLARCMLGVEENSSKEVGQVIHHLDLIRRATGACVNAVHHTGHAAGRARGSSALLGAVDTELEVVGDDGRVTLRVTKMKDGIEPNPRHFTAEPSGDSVVLVAGRGSDPDKLPAGARATLDALQRVMVPGGITATVWKVSAGVADRTFYNHRAGLLQSGQVVNEGTDRSPRYIIGGAK